MSGKSKSLLTQLQGKPLTYRLPSPGTQGHCSVEEVLARRRSHRSFSEEAVTAHEISQLLWAAYGITPLLPGTTPIKKFFRSAPSAGATYPLELYLLAGKVTGLEAGVYRYVPGEHSIVRVIPGDVRKGLCRAAWDQEMIGTAPACLFYSAVFNRTTGRYGRRGAERYVCMDLGHSAQNVYLMAGALNLGTCAIGAFDDATVKAVMQLPELEEPLYIMPVGNIL